MHTRRHENHLGQSFSTSVQMNSTWRLPPGVYQCSKHMHDLVSVTGFIFITTASSHRLRATTRHRRLGSNNLCLIVVSQQRSGSGLLIWKLQLVPQKAIQVWVMSEIARPWVGFRCACQWLAPTAARLCLVSAGLLHEMSRGVAMLLESSWFPSAPDACLLRDHSRCRTLRGTTTVRI
jgi:hypothetical protein